MAERFWPDGAPRRGGLEDVDDDPHIVALRDAADQQYAMLLKFAEFIGKDEQVVQEFIKHLLGEVASGYLARKAAAK